MSLEGSKDEEGESGVPTCVWKCLSECSYVHRCTLGETISSPELNDVIKQHYKSQAAVSWPVTVLWNVFLYDAILQWSASIKILSFRI